MRDPSLLERQTRIFAQLLLGGVPTATCFAWEGLRVRPIEKTTAHGELATARGLLSMGTSLHRGGWILPGVPSCLPMFSAPQ
jgi:hypothetical protein